MELWVTLGPSGEGASTRPAPTSASDVLPHVYTSLENLFSSLYGAHAVFALIPCSVHIILGELDWNFKRVHKRIPKCKMSPQTKRLALGMVGAQSEPCLVAFFQPCSDVLVYIYQLLL